MRVIQLVRELRSQPTRYLECCTAVHLGAFLHGYDWVETSLQKPLQELAEHFGGPSGANVFTRVYLTVKDAREGVDCILRYLEERVGAGNDWVVEPRDDAGQPFMAVVGDYLRQRRPGLFLGEPTVTWLHHFVQGFLAGVAVVDPEAGRRQTEQLADFGRWLAADNDCASAEWHRALRSFYAETNGIYELPRLWDEFLAREHKSDSAVT